MCKTASRGPLCLASSRTVLACSSLDVSSSLVCGLLLDDAAACWVLFVETDSSIVDCTGSWVVFLSSSGRVGASLVRGCKVLSFGVASTFRGCGSTAFPLLRAKVPLCLAKPAAERGVARNPRSTCGLRKVKRAAAVMAGKDPANKSRGSRLGGEWSAMATECQTIRI